MTVVDDAISAPETAPHGRRGVRGRTDRGEPGLPAALGDEGLFNRHQTDDVWNRIIPIRLRSPRSVVLRKRGPKKGRALKRRTWVRPSLRSLKAPRPSSRRTP